MKKETKPNLKEIIEQLWWYKLGLWFYYIPIRLNNLFKKERIERRDWKRDDK